MSTMAFSPSLWAPWARWLTELRIDVHLPEDRIAAELDALNTRGERLLSSCKDLSTFSNLPSRLVAKIRQADGEHFIYVVEVLTQRIVAYVTLNRLVEVNRKAEVYFRSPHTKVSAQYRRRGIATAVYRWWLDDGRCLMTGARQSPAARGLWLSMSKYYKLTYVLLENKHIHHLGDELSADVLGRLNSRAVLLGRGCSLKDKSFCTGQAGRMVL